MNLAGLLLRTASALVFSSSGARKLIRPGAIAGQLWRPFRLSDRAWGWTIAAVGGAEIMVAIALVGAASAYAISIGISALAGLTTYGIVASSKGYWCGCSHNLERSDPSRLLLRNLFLAVLIVAGAVALPDGPDVRTLSEGALVLAIAGVVLVLYRALITQSQSPAIARGTPPG